MNQVRLFEQVVLQSSVYGALKRMVAFRSEQLTRVLVVSATADGVTVEGANEEGMGSPIFAIRFPEGTKRVLFVADSVADEESLNIAALLETGDHRVLVAYVKCDFRSAGSLPGLCVTEVAALAEKAGAVRNFSFLPHAQSVAIGMKAGASSYGRTVVVALHRTPGVWRAFASLVSPSETWLEEERPEGQRTSLIGRLLSFRASSAPAIGATGGDVIGILPFSDQSMLIATSDGLLSVYSIPSAGIRGEVYAETRIKLDEARKTQEPAWTLGWAEDKRVVYVAEGSRISAFEVPSLRKLAFEFLSPYSSDKPIQSLAWTEASSSLWASVGAELFGIQGEKLRWVASRSWFTEAAKHQNSTVRAETLAHVQELVGSNHPVDVTRETDADDEYPSEVTLFATESTLFSFRSSSVVSQVLDANSLESLALTFLAIPFGFGRSIFRPSSVSLATLFDGSALWRVALAGGLISQQLGAGDMALFAEYVLAFAGVEEFNAELYAAFSKIDSSIANKISISDEDLVSASAELKSLLEEQQGRASVDIQSGTRRLGLSREVAELVRDVYLYFSVRDFDVEFPIGDFLRRLWAVAVKSNVSASEIVSACLASKIEYLGWALSQEDSSIFRRATAAVDEEEIWLEVFNTDKDVMNEEHWSVVVEALKRNSRNMIHMEDLRDIVDDALVAWADAEDGEKTEIERGLYLIWLSTIRTNRRASLLEAAARAFNRFPYLQGKLLERLFTTYLRARDWRACAKLISDAMAQEAAERASRLLIIEAEEELNKLFPEWPWYLKLATVEYLRERSKSCSIAKRRLWGALMLMGKKDEASELAMSMVESGDEWAVLASVSVKKGSLEEEDLRRRATLAAARSRTGETEIVEVVKKLENLEEAAKVAKAAGLDLWADLVKVRMQKHSLKARDVLLATGRDFGVVLGLARWRAMRGEPMESDIVIEMEHGNRWVLLLDILMRARRWDEAVKLVKAHLNNWRPKKPGHVLSEIVPVAKLQQLRDCCSVFAVEKLTELDPVLEELKRTLQSLE